MVILYDDEVELREAFTVLITHDRNRVAKVKVKSSKVTLQGSYRGQTPGERWSGGNQVGLF